VLVWVCVCMETRTESAFESLLRDKVEGQDDDFYKYKIIKYLKDIFYVLSV
jgi:hypothetical protein